MTALQDWLTFSPVTPQSVKSLVRGVLRVGPQPDEYRRAPKIMQRGIDRC